VAATARPIVFLTDYGLADEFVGVCHGVIARIAPTARVIDLTHCIPAHDVLRGALALGRATPFMPPDAVYVAVVDPGVGSGRRAVALEAASGAFLVGPDNGVLSLAWVSLGGIASANEITSEVVRAPSVSRTFHGRDVFAPAAAHLATGFQIADAGPEVDPETLQILDLPGPMVAPGAVGARVLGVDGFGNVQLNVEPEHLRAAGLGDVLSLLGRSVPLVGTFADVPRGALAAIVDSQGHIALVVNHGSAAAMLALGQGATVVLE
jgi:S-adenosyl-L-methionine hydrolase (adenosine-forming)